MDTIYEIIEADVAWLNDRAAAEDWLQAHQAAGFYRSAKVIARAPRAGEVDHMEGE